MLLMIDNYDSFTFNLVRGFRELGEEVLVYRNDEITPDQVADSRPGRVVISPGPGRPDAAGFSVDIVRRLAGKVPILGVCLGHQAIGCVFGADIMRAGRVMHGKVSQIRHDGTGLFADLPSPFPATRYHSLVIRKGTLPSHLKPTAWSCDDDEIMAIADEDAKLYGVQFHPESVMTPLGSRLLRSFLMA